MNAISKQWTVPNVDWRSARLNYLNRALELAEQLDDALRGAEMHGSDANARTPMEDVTAYIVSDILEAEDE